MSETYLEDSVKNPCLCGSKSYEFIYDGKYNRQISNYSYSLYQCKQCLTVRTFPVPDMSLYTEGYTASTASTKEYLEREKPWCKDLALEIKNILDKNPELKKLPVIDIGCNGGELVEQLNKLGMTAEGCDIDPIAVNHGLKKNLHLFIRDLAEQPLDKTYGLIMMNHTLEHIVPAREVIKNVCNSLASGGILQIHVPNYRSWISKVMKGKWGFLAPHEHVWQFTPETLKSFIEASLPGQLTSIDIRCKTNLETAEGKGIKIFIKKIIIFAASKFNNGDEIIATFRKS